MCTFSPGPVYPRRPLLLLWPSKRKVTTPVLARQLTSYSAHRDSQCRVCFKTILPALSSPCVAIVTSSESGRALDWRGVGEGRQAISTPYLLGPRDTDTDQHTDNARSSSTRETRRNASMQFSRNRPEADNGLRSLMLSNPAWYEGTTVSNTVIRNITALSVSPHCPCPCAAVSCEKASCLIV